MQTVTAPPGVPTAANDGPVAEGPGGVAPEMAKVQEAQPLRTFVRDGVVLTVTGSGVAAHDARTFGRLAFTPYSG